MGFDSFISVLLSVLVPKFIENESEKRNTRAVMGLKLIIIAIICFMVPEINGFIKSILNQKAYECYQNITNAISFRFIVIAVFIFLIYLAYRNQLRNICCFNDLQGKITEFTEKASGNQAENSELYILCGDMDVWGNCEDSREFQQLSALQKSHQELDIRILCKHCIKEEYVKKIADETYVFDPDEFKENVIDEMQINRISDFRQKLSRCSFRFYTKSCDDLSHLRARVIRNTNISRVLIYQKTERKFGFLTKQINKFLKKEVDPFIYEFLELEDGKDSYQKMHYVELCNLKWDNCDAALSEKIANLCEQYVKYQRMDQNVKRIAFVYAKTFEVAHYGTSRMEFPPFGVLYLATAVKEFCGNWLADVIALDENALLNKQELIMKFSKYEVVAFSIVSAYTVPLFVKAMNLIKTSGIKKPICIAGGYQAELESEQLLKKEYVSLVMRGEGEETIVKLLNKSDEQDFGPKLYGSFDNILYMTGNKKNKHLKGLGTTPVCVDLNRIPIPDRSFLAVDHIVMKRDIAGNKYKMAHILISRGCSYQCAYCGVRREGNRVVRYRHPDNILKELNQLKEKYEIEAFSIIDDCFLTNRIQAIEIIQQIKSVGLIWSLAARIDQIDEEVLTNLKDSGCSEIKFGLETGSDTILKKMEKGITVDQAKQVLNLVHNAGISAKVFIISGLPGETKKTNQETISFLREMGTEKIKRVSLLRFVPLPGSKVYENPHVYGINVNVRNTLENLEQYKRYRLYDAETNWWENEMEFKIRNECYKKLKDFIDSVWPKEVY